MKRALPSYEDLSVFTATEEEEGEILESSDVDTREREEEEIIQEFGLKSVLPVGKFDETFKVGDTPGTGEQYLCTVRLESSLLPIVTKTTAEDSFTSVSIEKLLKSERKVPVVEFEAVWCEAYWNSYRASEKEFHVHLTTDFGPLEDIPQFKGSLSWKSFWWEALYGDSEGGLKPSICILVQLKEQQDLVLKLLSLHGQWLKEGNELHCKIVEGNTTCLDLVATWLQALLMCLDCQLTSPEISILRDLVFVLAAARESLTTEFNEIILVICKKYKQTDLIKITK